MIMFIEILISSLNEITVVHYNPSNYDSHLITQELGKSDLKINVMPNVLEEYMSFTINNKLNFIDNFQFQVLIDRFKVLH